MIPDMDCIDLVEITTEYFDGTLSLAEVARLEHHLTECDGCTEYLRQMRVTQETLGRPDAAERLLALADFARPTWVQLALI